MRTKIQGIGVAVDEQMKTIYDKLSKREKNFEVTKFSTKTYAL